MDCYKIKTVVKCLIIYVDVLFIVNLVITYFLLIASALISGYAYSRKRIVCAAVLGALCCLYIFVQTDNLFTDIAVKILSLVLCSSMAIGIKNIKKFLIQMLCFVLFNSMLMGVIMLLSVKSAAVYHKNLFFYIDINPVILVLMSVVIYLTIFVFSFIKDETTAQGVTYIDIVLDECVLKNIAAFYDSGCKVRDIVSNRDIVIVSFEDVHGCLPLKLKNDIDCFFSENFKDIKTCFVPVFFNTVLGDGMIPAIKSKEVKFADKTINDVLIAFVKGKLSENVTAIFGTSIKRQL